MKHPGGKRIVIRLMFSVLSSAWLLVTGCFVALAVGPGDLIINRLQITGGTGQTDADFVTIYNKSSSAIDLNGLRLVKRTKTGTSDTTIKSWTSPLLLNPGASYTWANSSIALSINADTSSTQTLSNDNAVAIRVGAENTGQIIDGVGWGAAANSLLEGSPYPVNPGANEKLERISYQDTNNNALDFHIVGAAPLAECGNGIIEAGEACDDHNLINNDGCSDGCQIETPAPLPAMPAHILINEFVADPVSGEDEWVELYNAGDQSVDLTDWTLEDGSGTKTILAGTIGATAETKYFVINKPSGSLNNSGDAIILKNAAGTVINQVAYGDWNDGNLSDNAPTAADPNSIARIADGVSTNNDLADFSITSTITKNAANVITGAAAQSTAVDEPKYDYSKDILITEIYPDPAGIDSETMAAEFIEIYNRSDRFVSLRGWRLDIGGRYMYEFPQELVLENKKYLVVRSDKGFSLDNGGITIKLLQPSHQTSLQTVTYKEATEGESYMMFDETGNRLNPVWKWSFNPTAGEKNVLVSKPNAAFSLSGAVGLGQPIIFDSSDTDTGGIDTQYSWDFDDGMTSTLKNPEHSYTTEGDFKTTLTVTNKYGTSTISKKIEINKRIPDLIISSELQRDDAPINYSLAITEVFPNPKGADKDKEWIEIKNNGSETINLKNWSIALQSKNGKPINEDIIIQPNTFVLLPSRVFPSALPNTNASIALFDPQKRPAVSVTYVSAPEDQAYALIGANWQWTKKPTPGTVNVLLATTPASKTKSSASASNKRQIFNGIVVALPNTFSSQYFFIKLDDVAQLQQVYNSKKLFPNLKLGDRISVIGEASTTKNGPRIKTRAAEDISVLAAETVPEPEIITTKNLSDLSHPELVKLAGEVTSKKSPRLILTDAEGDAEIYLSQGSKLTISAFALGDKISVTGISQSNEGKIRIMPRSEDDITFAHPAGGPTATASPETIAQDAANNQRDERKNLLNYIILAAVAALGGAGYWVWRKRK